MQPVIHHITAFAGHSLAVYLWPLPHKPKAWVYLNHSFGAYHTRFTSLAHFLLRHGYAVSGHDIYGHGISGGRRADTPDFHTSILDTCSALDFCRQHQPVFQRLPLAAFSFGTGSIANSLIAARKLQPIDALIVASPYLRLYKTPYQKLLTTLLPLRWLPFISTPTNVTPEKLVHSPEVRKAYISDPLLHKKIYVRSYLYMRDGAREMQELASQWHTPTLMLYTLNDPVADHTATENFIRQLPPDLVSSHIMQNASHIFFQENDRDMAYERIVEWLNQRFAHEC